MDLIALKTFKLVSDFESVTRAAEELCCVPSAVTARIRQLENEVGQQLFVRGPRGMLPTARGRLLMDYAKRAVVLFDEAEKAVRDDDKPRGTLRIGATTTAAIVYLPETFARYHRTFPDVNLQVSSNVTEELVADVSEHRLDVAIVNRAVSEKHFRQEHIRRERLVLISAPSVENLCDLEEFTFLSAPAGCVQRARIEQWLVEGASPPIRFIDMANIEMRVSCAVAGMGVAVLPRSLLARLGQKGAVRVHEIPQPWNQLDTYLVCRRDSASFSAKQAFRDMMLEECRTVIPFDKADRS